ALRNQGEAVPTLRVEVQLGGAAGCPPRLVERQVAAHVDQLVVAGRGLKQRRRIGRYPALPPLPVDRRGEVRPALRVVPRRRADGGVGAGREAHDAQAIGGDVPPVRLLSDRAQRLQPVGDYHGPDLIHLWPVWRRISRDPQERLI